MAPRQAPRQAPRRKRASARGTANAQDTTPGANSTVPPAQQLSTDAPVPSQPPLLAVQHATGPPPLVPPFPQYPVPFAASQHPFAGLHHYAPMYAPYPGPPTQPTLLGPAPGIGGAQFPPWGYLHYPPASQQALLPAPVVTQPGDPLATQGNAGSARASNTANGRAPDTEGIEAVRTRNYPNRQISEGGENNSSYLGILKLTQWKYGSFL